MSERHEGILILGAPRSGTSLLRRLIGAHPDIASAGETNLFSACSRFLHEERIAEGVDIGVTNGLAFLGIEEDELLRRLREFAFSFQREHAAAENKTRWADKTAFDCFHLDAIEHLCSGHVHFVGIVRHALDTVLSIQELSDKNLRYLGELHGYVQRYPRPLEAFAHAWVDVNERLRKLIDTHSDHAVLIRYEDLVADPDATMSRVMEAVGERWDPAWLATTLDGAPSPGFSDWKTYGLKEVSSASVGRAAALSPITRSELAAIVNPTLSACGYEPVETVEALSREEARRRYQLGLMVGGMKPDAEKGGD